MRCLKCGQETTQNAWGDWCDACHGVMAVTQGEPKLFFRHVATVEGTKGRYPIVFDLSAGAYGVAWPKPVILTKCQHCGMMTRVDDRSGLAKLDDLRSTPYHSTRGSLDAMLALIQPIARGDSLDFPLLSGASSATDEELSFLGIDKREGMSS